MTRAGWYLLVSAGALLGQSAPPVVTVVAETGTNTQLLSPGAFVYVLGTGFGTKAAVNVNGVGALVLETTPTALTIQMPTTAVPGPATLVVTTTVGSSAPFAFLISPVSPSILTDDGATPPTSYFTLSGTLLYDLAPGDSVEVPVNGLGPQSPPPTPVVLIDGNPVTVLGTSSLTWNFFLLGGMTVNMPTVQFRIPNLAYGHHGVQIQIGGVTTNPLALDLFFSGLVVSPAGLTFNAVQGGPVPPPQTTTVLSGVGNLNFSVSPSTVSGGMWLTVSPQSGSAEVGQTGTSLRVAVNPSGLSAGTYYGTLQVTAPGLANSPQLVSVVLNVSAATANIGAVLSSAGLIFVGSAGEAAPPAQMVTVYNPSASSLSFTSALAGTNAAAHFNYNLVSGSMQPGQTLTLTIGVSTAGISAGTYNGTITMTFSDGSTRVISLLLLVTSGTTPSAIRPGPLTTASGCKPTKLLPVFLGPGNNFNVPAAWPTPILVTVVDDCGSDLLTGSVHVEFSNGDPVLSLASLNNGSWAVTWPPGNPRSSGITITAVAAAADSNLVGNAQITGGVAANPNVPVLSAGGIVDLAAYGGVVSPGSLIAVFGSQLAAAQAQAPTLPLPILLSNTTLYLGAEPVPLIFTSSGQVNAMMPYDVTPEATHPLIAQVGTALSAPQTVLVASAHPAVFTVDQSGTGAGVIVHGSTGALITSSSPAQPGEVVVIYCTGLGAVTPPVPAGTATPLNSLTTTVTTVTATIGGAPANVLFAGISPGSTGLYQVNAVVPTGLPKSDATSVILSVGTQASPAVTIALQN